MKLLLLLVPFATGFAPITPTKSSSSLAFDKSDYVESIGVTAPLGFWDPLGLIKNGPYGTPAQNFDHYRAVEIKHGRIAGVAIIGLLTAETTRFQGLLSPSANLDFKDLPNGVAGLKAMPIEGLAQIALFVGVHELLLCKQVENSVPGDFGLGYFGVSIKDEAVKKVRDG